MFGSHLSIAGGMHNALLEAQTLGMDCVQVFTKNQRQWQAAPLSHETIKLWHEHQTTTGIKQTVSHDSYLINLAAPHDEAWLKSAAAFQDELERCEALAIPWLVTHPGAAMGQSDETALRRVAEALDRVHERTQGFKTITCLEITAGQGTCLGWRFEHLRDVIAMVRQPVPRGGLRFWIQPTCWRSSYDLTSAKGAKAVFAECDQVLGLERVRVLHVNDSKTAQGSRVDRHEHIGHGHVALEAFAVLLNHQSFTEVPKILETAKEKHSDGRPWDAVNLEVLRRLVKKRPAPAKHGRKIRKPR